MLFLGSTFMKVLTQNNSDFKQKEHNFEHDTEEIDRHVDVRIVIDIIALLNHLGD